MCVYAGRADHPRHGHIEVLGYQNTAGNHADGPNAMLLHLPSAAPMGPRNFLPTGRHTDLLTRMAEAVPGPAVHIGHPPGVCFHIRHAPCPGSRRPRRPRPRLAPPPRPADP